MKLCVEEGSCFSLGFTRLIETCHLFLFSSPTSGRLTRTHKHTRFVALQAALPKTQRIEKQNKTGDSFTTQRGGPLSKETTSFLLFLLYHGSSQTFHLVGTQRRAGQRTRVDASSGLVLLPVVLSSFASPHFAFFCVCESLHVHLDLFCCCCWSATSQNVAAFCNTTTAHTLGG